MEVYKLIAKDSIDESMLKIQNHKLELGENLSEELQGMIHLNRRNSCGLILIILHFFKSQKQRRIWSFC